MERASESAAKKVIQQATDRAAAMVEEHTRQPSRDAAQLDEKVRKAQGCEGRGGAGRSAGGAANCGDQLEHRWKALWRRRCRSARRLRLRCRYFLRRTPRRGTWIVEERPGRHGADMCARRPWSNRRPIFPRQAAAGPRIGRAALTAEGEREIKRSFASCALQAGGCRGTRYKIARGSLDESSGGAGSMQSVAAGLGAGTRACGKLRVPTARGREGCDRAGARRHGTRLPRHNARQLRGRRMEVIAERTQHIQPILQTPRKGRARPDFSNELDFSGPRSLKTVQKAVSLLSNVELQARADSGQN